MSSEPLPPEVEAAIEGLTESRGRSRYEEFARAMLAEVDARIARVCAGASDAMIAECERRYARREPEYVWSTCSGCGAKNKPLTADTSNAGALCNDCYMKAKDGIRILTKEQTRAMECPFPPEPGYDTPPPPKEPEVEPAETLLACPYCDGGRTAIDPVDGCVLHSCSGGIMVKRWNKIARAARSSADDGWRDHASSAIKARLAGKERVLGDILEERSRQDLKWGGPEHDDTHVLGDWLSFILERTDHLTGAPAPEVRKDLIELAALAVAAVESIDRKGVSRAARGVR